MIEFGAVQFEWGTILFQLLAFFPVLLLYAFIIYFLIMVLIFMRKKQQLDRERNEKLEQLLSIWKNEQEKRTDGH